MNCPYYVLLLRQELLLPFSLSGLGPDRTWRLGILEYKALALWFSVRTITSFEGDPQGRLYLTPDQITYST